MMYNCTKGNFAKLQLNRPNISLKKSFFSFIFTGLSLQSHFSPNPQNLSQNGPHGSQISKTLQKCGLHMLNLI